MKTQMPATIPTRCTLSCVCVFARAQGENVPRVDALIRKNFERLVFLAEAGKLTETWSKRPRSLVALILVLDQFSR